MLGLAVERGGALTTPNTPSFTLATSDLHVRPVSLRKAEVVTSSDIPPTMDQ